MIEQYRHRDDVGVGIEVDPNVVGAHVYELEYIGRDELGRDIVIERRWVPDTATSDALQRPTTVMVESEYVWGQPRPAVTHTSALIRKANGEPGTTYTENNGVIGRDKSSTRIGREQAPQPEDPGPPVPPPDSPPQLGETLAQIRADAADRAPRLRAELEQKLRELEQELGSRVNVDELLDERTGHSETGASVIASPSGNWPPTSPR